jgi:hypothetical protein
MFKKYAQLLAVLAVTAAVPAVAIAGPPSGAAGSGHKPALTSDDASSATPSSTTPANPGKHKGKAIGKSCKGLSKKHVKGQKGTPFSRCVQAKAKANKGDDASSAVPSSSTPSGDDASTTTPAVDSALPAT